MPQLVKPPMFIPNLNGSSKIDRLVAVRALSDTLQLALRQHRDLTPHGRDYLQGQYADGQLAFGLAREAHRVAEDVLQQMMENLAESNERIF